MTQSSKKNRIIFIDLMRAFAVLMMVQGHTVDVLLSNENRNPASPFFVIWLFMRGMTAPIFMFSAGTVFTYLFRLAAKNKSEDEPFKNNPRVIKGIKRFLLLVGLGYLLRYPTPSIVDFSAVDEKGWDVFFAVDVLQLIGFGILFLIICAYIVEKTKLSDYLVFSLVATLFFLAYPFVIEINWLKYLPVQVAGYFYYGTGSNFPLFPWVGYVLFGGVLGSYLAKNPTVFKTPGFSFKLGIVGAVFIIVSFIFYPIEKLIYGAYAADNLFIQTILLRVGFVLMLNAIVSYISLRIENIPGFIILIGRNTLLIYVVHLMILYGSAWNPGLNQLFAKSFDVWKTIGIVLLMIALMTSMVLAVNKFKLRNKELVT